MTEEVIFQSAQGQGCYYPMVTGAVEVRSGPEQAHVTSSVHTAIDSNVGQMVLSGMDDAVGKSEE